MSRYKTKIFDNFSDGEQCDLIEATEKSFEKSNDLVIEGNKMKLGKKIKTGALYNMDLSSQADDEWASRCSFLYNGLFHIIGSHLVTFECVIKYISVTTGAINTLHTFPAGTNWAYMLLKFKNKMIVSLEDGANYKIQYATLTAPGVWNNCGTIGVGLEIMDYEIVGQRLYILTNDKKIYYSDDGIAFTLFVTLDSVYAYESFNYVDGYFYVGAYKAGFYSCSLIRISLDGEIQNQIVSITSARYFRSFAFNGNLYIILNRRFLYRVNGSALKPIFKFENKVSILFSFGFVDFSFFYDSTTSEIIAMDIFEKFFRPFPVVSGTDLACTINNFDNLISMALCKHSANAQVILYENSYTASGNVKTYTFKIPEDLAVPKQLILINKALTANARIKVYVKKDQAAAWGSAVIDSDALNAVRKNYTFPAGTQLSFIQFKIEYITANSAETPEDAILKFIYLPIGLANSK